MLFYLGQINPLRTSPVLDFDGEPRLDAVITAALYLDGVLVDGSEITFQSKGGGVYLGKIPIIAADVGAYYIMPISVTIDGEIVDYTEYDVKYELKKK